MIQMGSSPFSGGFNRSPAFVDAAAGTSHAQGTSEKGCWGSSRTRLAPLEFAAMVGGFIVFWPLGLLALFFKFKNKEMWKGSSEGTWPWANGKGERMSFTSPFKGHNWGQRFTSGNHAFDAYKRQQLERLEAERRKLDDEQRAFADYMRRLDEAKDKEEFDRFMAEHSNAAPKPSDTPTA